MIISRKGEWKILRWEKLLKNEDIGLDIDYEGDAERLLIPEETSELVETGESTHLRRESTGSSRSGETRRGTAAAQDSSLPDEPNLPIKSMDIEFEDRAGAELFAQQWGRFTKRGHSIDAGKTDVKVRIWDVTPEEKTWVEAYIAEKNNEIALEAAASPAIQPGNYRYYAGDDPLETATRYQLLNVVEVHDDEITSKSYRDGVLRSKAVPMPIQRQGKPPLDTRLVKVPVAEVTQYLKKKVYLNERLRDVIPYDQQRVLKGEMSKDNFWETQQTVVRPLEVQWAQMPNLYEQVGLGDQSVVYAHYFYGGSDWWITEYNPEESKAFGYVVLNGDYLMAGLRYIAIEELTTNGKVELDFFWTPQTLEKVKGTLRVSPDQKETLPPAPTDEQILSQLKEWDLPFDFAQPQLTDSKTFAFTSARFPSDRLEVFVTNASLDYFLYQGVEAVPFTERATEMDNPFTVEHFSRAQQVARELLEQQYSFTTRLRRVDSRLRRVDQTSGNTKPWQTLRPERIKDYGFQPYEYYEQKTDNKFVWRHKADDNKELILTDHGDKITVVLDAWENIESDEIALDPDTDLFDREKIVVARVRSFIERWEEEFGDLIFENNDSSAAGDLPAGRQGSDDLITPVSEENYVPDKPWEDIAQLRDELRFFNIKIPPEYEYDLPWLADRLQELIDTQMTGDGAAGEPVPIKEFYAQLAQDLPDNDYRKNTYEVMAETGYLAPAWLSTVHQLAQAHPDADPPAPDSDEALKEAARAELDERTDQRIDTDELALLELEAEALKVKLKLLDFTT